MPSPNKLCGIRGEIVNTMNRAFAAVELSFLQPLEFIRLPIAGALGWIAFGDTTDIYTWIGGTVIFFASIYGTRGRAA